MKRLRSVGWFSIIVLITLAGCTTPQKEPTRTAIPTDTPIPLLTHTPTSAKSRTPIPSLTPTPAVAEIRVDPAVTYQTMDGFGADCWTFPYANDLEWNWEAVKYVFDELDIAYIRLAPWLGWWETANDNEDPFTINWDGFGTIHDIINQHDVPFGQYLTQRNIELSVGVWDIGGVIDYCDTCSDWLASGQPRQIPPDLYPELGESIAAYILHMRNKGVPIALAEVQNEPDIEASIQYASPEALRDAGRVVVQMLDHYGLQDVQLHAPNLHSPSSNVRWIDAWFADETLRQRTAAVSYHTWWSEYRNDYEEIWQAAQKYGKPVWATEAGYSGSATSIDPKKWETAFGFGESYFRAIAWSHASRVYHWALLGFDGAVGKNGERYPMFYALKHFANYIPAGSVLLESQSEDTRVGSLAFHRPDETYSIILLNSNSSPRTVTVNGLEAEVIQIITSSEKAYDAAGELTADGTITLPPLSITSMVYKP
jgi:hypothetical protein